MAHRFAVLLGIGLILVAQFGCIGLNTFPYRAQAGDTITLGGGLDLGLGNEFMDRTNTTITLTKDGDPAFTPRDLSAQMRALFHLYPDARSHIWNYNIFLGPLSQGRPFETGIALDLPTDLQPGIYTVTVASTATFNDWAPKLEIIDDPNVAGEANCFQDQSGFCNDITVLERQPYVRVSFNPGVKIGALDVTLTYDPVVVPTKDINVVSPRINYGSAGFGTTNRDHLRMFFWMPVNNEIKVHYVCPTGVSSEFMFFDVVYPRGKQNPVNMTTATLTAYDLNGADITSTVTYSMEAH